jgi:PhnB protein
MQVNPYLTFNGNCEEAFNYYQTVFGGTIEAMLPHAGTPAEEHVPAEWRKKIMHARIRFGDNVLMASDSPPQFQRPMEGFSVSINVDSTAEAERVFQALADGGVVKMPIQPTFWAERFGMLIDRFGTPWMVNHEKKPP